MAVNLINSNDIEVEQTGQDIQLKTSTPISTLEGGISDNTTNIQNIKDGNVYSTTQEIDTGKTLDGKPVYRSYLEIQHSSPGSVDTNHNLSIDKIVDVKILVTVARQTIEGNGYRPNPYISGSNSFMVTAITSTKVNTNAVGWSGNAAYIWLEYTKTTD